MTVPRNTPDYTIVYLDFKDDPFWKMERIGDYTWRLEVDNLPSKQYRYNRNGLGFTSSEELLPDAKDIFRTYPDDTYETIDTVSKWRWFPADGEPLPEIEIDSQAEIIGFQPRIDDTEFQTGICYQDFWWDPFNELVAPTNSILQKQGFQWVELMPTWAYVQTQPTPLLGEVEYSYTDQQLRKHLSQLKEDGFNIILTPQLYGNVPELGSYSDSWWEAWYNEFERYSLYFANIAEEYGVEYLSITGDWIAYMDDTYPAPDAGARLNIILDKVRSNYSGKLGKQIFIGGGTPGDYYEIFPPLERTPILDAYDFFAASLWSGLTTANDANQDELSDNAEILFTTRIDPLFDSYSKPVIFYQIAYPSHDGGATGVELPEGTTAEWEPYQSIKLDLEEQAMAYEAIMRSVARRPYVIGTYPFVWFIEDFPLSVAYTIRSKPAETVVIDWYQAARN